MPRWYGGDVVEASFIGPRSPRAASRRNSSEKRLLEEARNGLSTNPVLPQTFDVGTA